jgi:Coenzyme PQQ synthesis protein D (PqqD)
MRFRDRNQGSAERKAARACPPVSHDRLIDSVPPPRYLNSGFLHGLVGFVMEIASGTVLRLAEDASVQHVGDGAVVLLARSGQLYTCNGTTEAFLDKVDGARNLDQIVDLLCEEFEVDKGTLDQDIAALATDLVSEGILAAPGA